MSAPAESGPDELGDYVVVSPEDRVHVWVVALQTCREPQAYDPLDLGQWEFRVMPHRELLRQGQTSARLSFFERLGIDADGYSDLGGAVRQGRIANDAL